MSDPADTLSEMTTVQATTDQLPALADALAERKAHGLDTYDEWWDGVYRVVTGPSPEHGELLLRLGIFLVQLADRRGLGVSPPVNIGVDKQDARVPDIGVYQRDTPRSSPAFLTTAVLVVEILSPGEKAGAKLDFYARWLVDEYLEIDLRTGGARLLVRDDTEWLESTVSPALGFAVEPGALVAGAARVELPVLPEG
jgi:Uma2 family endonuclease